MKFLLYVFSLGFIAFSFTLASCRKPPGPGIAEITVVDTVGNPVSGAAVELTSKSYDPSSIVSDKQVTGSNGKTTHSFEDEMVLDVIVTRDTMEARDIVNITLGETSQRTVTLK